MAAYRWSGGQLPAFCTQVILAAILQLSEHVNIQNVDHVGVNVWKALVFGRVSVSNYVSQILISEMKVASNVTPKADRASSQCITGMY